MSVESDRSEPFHLFDQGNGAIQPDAEPSKYDQKRSERSPSAENGLFQALVIGR